MMGEKKVQTVSKKKKNLKKDESSRVYGLGISLHAVRIHNL